MKQLFSNGLRAVLILLLCAAAGATAPVFADEDSQIPERLRTVFKSLAYLDVQDVPQMLGLLDVEVVVDRDRQTVVLRGREDLDVALQLLDILDEPPALSPNVELTVYVLTTDPDGQDAPDGELGAVAKRLSGLFGYPGLRLLDSLFLRVRNGGPGLVQGSLPDAQGTPVPYLLKFRRATVHGFDRSRQDPAKEERRLRLDGLDFMYGEGNASMATDVEVKMGQKAVVGKATPSNGSEPLILVIEAQILDTEG